MSNQNLVFRGSVGSSTGQKQSKPSLKKDILLYISLQLFQTYSNCYLQLISHPPLYLLLSQLTPDWLVSCHLSFSSYLISQHHLPRLIPFFLLHYLSLTYLVSISSWFSSHLSSSFTGTSYSKWPLDLGIS